MNPVWIAGVGMTPCGKSATSRSTSSAGAPPTRRSPTPGCASTRSVRCSARRCSRRHRARCASRRRLGHTGVPVTGIESASAGGLVALRHAAWAVWSGRVDTALAVGYEKMTALEPGGIVPTVREIWDRFPPQVVYASWAIGSCATTAPAPRCSPRLPRSRGTARRATTWRDAGRTTRSQSRKCSRHAWCRLRSRA